MVPTEWHWIERFGQQFELCNLTAGETAVLLSENRSRPELVETARLALHRAGAGVTQVVMPTPANPGPVPIRSTGASVAIAGNPAAIAALCAADFVVDCTVEGLLHAPELGQILGAGTRVLMISNEHPENFERWPHDEGMATRVSEGKRLLDAAGTMTVTSPSGTDLTIDLAGAVRAGSTGVAAEAGDIAHWPGGLVLAFPAAGAVNGQLVLAPGDVNLTFKEYIRSPVRLTIANDHITAIEAADPSQPLDAELFASYLASFDEPEAYATSHVGWGMNAHARWDTMPMMDKSDFNGTEARAFAGNFLYSTGANEVAGRFCRGHFDLPMRNCTISLSGGLEGSEETVIVRNGVLQGPLSPADRNTTH